VPPVGTPCAFFVYRNEGGKRIAFRLVESLRSHGISVDMAFGDRALRKQFSAADRAGARYAVVVDEDSGAGESVELKDLRGGEQRRVPSGDLVRVLSAGCSDGAPD